MFSRAPAAPLSPLARLISGPPAHRELEQTLNGRTQFLLRGARDEEDLVWFDGAVWTLRGEPARRQSTRSHTLPRLPPQVVPAGALPRGAWAAPAHHPRQQDSRTPDGGRLEGVG